MIEYESIHTVFFECGKYGHRQEACILQTDKKKVEKLRSEVASQVEKLDFEDGNWIVV